MAGFGSSNPSHLYVLNTSIILPCPWDRVKMSLPSLGSSVYSDTGYFSSIIQSSRMFQFCKDVHFLSLQIFVYIVPLPPMTLVDCQVPQYPFLPSSESGFLSGSSFIFQLKCPFSMISPLGSAPVKSPFLFVYPKHPLLDQYLSHCVLIYFPKSPTGQSEQ